MAFQICDVEDFRHAVTSAVTTLYPSLPKSAVMALAENDLLLHHVAVSLETPQFLDLLLAEIGVPDAKVRRLPTDTQMMKSAAAAVARFIQSGLALATNDQVEVRLTACEACEHATNSPKGRFGFEALRLIGLRGRMCSLCGCNIWAKAQLASERCPDSARGLLGRWPAI